jgi:hypothetical protein
MDTRPRPRLQPMRAVRLFVMGECGTSATVCGCSRRARRQGRAGGQDGGLRVRGGRASPQGMSAAPPAPEWLPPPPAGAGRRHLARLRRAARDAAGLQEAAVPGATGPVVIMGASGEVLALAAALAAGGRAVAVIERDRDAARRLAEQMARRGLAVTAGHAAAPLARAALVIEARGGAGAARRLSRALAKAPAGAVGVVLGEGQSGGRRGAVARVVLEAPGSGLAEVPSGAGAGVAAALVVAAGCVPLALAPGAGSVAARLLWRLEAVAEALAFAGMPPWEVDGAAEAVGLAPGPCALMDRLGVDAALARRRRFGPAGAEPGVIARMVAEGRLGRKGAVGWYRYPGGGGRVIDPLIDDLVREEAWFARRPELAVGAGAAGAALLLTLVDEAAALMAEGVPGAAVDLAAVLALGLAPGTGGPAWLLERWGSAAAAAALARVAAALPGVLPPPRGLDAAEGTGDRTV